MICQLRRALSAACALLLLSILACGSHGGASRDISAADLLARLGHGDAPFVLDVRTPEEYATGHVPGAVNIPHDQVGTRLDEIGDRRAGDVVVYCERGGRAAKAAAVLDQAGFPHVAHLAGDMAGWRAAGLPVEKP